jgi:hypothetical protein
MVPILLVLLVVPLVALGAGSTASAQVGPEQQLAERYAPIVRLKQQESACDTNGEPYVPMPVEIVFGDPLVSLRRQASDESEDPVLASAPVAADLATNGADTYIDLPGNPRNPGCDFERHARERMAGLAPTTYARVYVDEPREKLVVQYWFYFYFNVFTNTHESDWEMITLVWDTTDIDEALRTDPALVGYAQHGNGELARWNDAKLQREGTHPIVYPAAGSHGSYFSSDVFVGWGEGGTGFGCDDASGPSDRVPLQPVLMSNNPDPSGPLAWLTYQGRWGERQPWEFNGPKGPNLGKKWTDPIGAISDWRSSSLVVPTEDTLGPTATDFFCTASEAGSKILIYFGVYRWLFLLVVGIAVAIPVFLVMRSRRLLGASLAAYHAHWDDFLQIGLLAIPIGLIFNGFAVLLMENPPLDWLIKWLDDSAAARLLVAMLVALVQQAVLMAVVGPAVVQALADVLDGRQPDMLRSYRIVLRNLLPLAAAVTILTAVSSLLALIVVTIPVAIWLGVRWQFFGQAVILDGAASGRAALHTSAAAVRGHWWRTFVRSIAFQLIATLPGPLIGLVLLILGGTSVRFANGVSSVFYAATIPIAVIGLTLLYLQQTGREAPLNALTQRLRDPLPTPPHGLPAPPA